MGKGFHTWLHTNILVSAQVRRINGKQRFSYLRTGLPTLGWKHNQEEWKTFSYLGTDLYTWLSTYEEEWRKKFILGNRLASLTGDGLALLLAHVRALQISFQVLMYWALKIRLSTYISRWNLLVNFKIYLSPIENVFISNCKIYLSQIAHVFISNKLKMHLFQITNFSHLECRNLLTVLPWDASWHSLALGSEHKFFVAIIKLSTWVGSKPTSRLSWVIWLVRPFQCQYLRCPTFRSWDVMVPCEGQFPAAYHHHHEF